MKKTPQDPVQEHAPLGLQPLPGSENLLDDASAGYCSNGVCHVPVPKTP